MRLERSRPAAGGAVVDDLLRAYGSHVRNRARRFAGTASNADDIMQEVFPIVHRRAEHAVARRVAAVLGSLDPPSANTYLLAEFDRMSTSAISALTALLPARVGVCRFRIGRLIGRRVEAIMGVGACRERAFKAWRKRLISTVRRAKPARDGSG